MILAAPSDLALQESLTPQTVQLVSPQATSYMLRANAHAATESRSEPSNLSFRIRPSLLRSFARASPRYENTKTKALTPKVRVS